MATDRVTQGGLGVNPGISVVNRGSRKNCSVATTGVAGPEPWEGIPPGTIWIATCVDGVVESHLLRYKTDRHRARNYTTISALNALRKRLESR